MRNWGLRKACPKPSFRAVYIEPRTHDRRLISPSSLDRSLTPMQNYRRSAPSHLLSNPPQSQGRGAVHIHTQTYEPRQVYNPRLHYSISITLALSPFNMQTRPSLRPAIGTLKCTYPQRGCDAHVYMACKPLCSEAHARLPEANTRRATQ